jgi:hypothetical protein
MKCKTFAGGFDEIENEMNEWLSENPMIKIQSVTQCGNLYGIVLTIIYIQNDHSERNFVNVDTSTGATLNKKP